MPKIGWREGGCQKEGAPPPPELMPKRGWGQGIGRFGPGRGRTRASSESDGGKGRAR
jgi:hypothetical protein